MTCMKAIFHDIQSKTLFGENAINIIIPTHLNALKLFMAGAPPRTPLGELTTLPQTSAVSWGFPSPHGVSARRSDLRCLRRLG